MPTYRDIILKAQKAVDDFAEYLPELDTKIYRRLQRIINKLQLDDDGTILVNEDNLKLIDEVKEELQQIPKDRQYQKSVAGVRRTIDDIVTLQTAYFDSQFTDFLKPGVMNEIQTNAFSNAVKSLTDSGLNANVVDKAVDIVSKNVTSGSSFLDMSNQLREFMVSTPEIPSKLHSYAKQVVNDTIHTVSRDYNSKIADDLGLDWFLYVGGLMKTSRDWCIAMEAKKYIHRSELAAVCRGEVDGKQVSLQGLIPGTNPANVKSRCGGYNCEHHMAPVPSATVPTAIRRAFEPDLEPDDEETSEQRPRNKRR